ncbi:MAG: DUF1178 family protein [Rhodoferax sp.]|nr:DUF1178 family protein [Rhodoferax sp.]
MKVLDLACSHEHVFEGWFASEEDFASQHARGMVACPMCGDTLVRKKLSAPRLNLGSARAPDEPKQDVVAADPVSVDLQAAWLAMARSVLAQTEDVGERFAEEARRIHYGEIGQRAIRGKASRAETEALAEEGIAVLPLLLPDVLKGQLQ